MRLLAKALPWLCHLGVTDLQQVTCLHVLKCKMKAMAILPLQSCKAYLPTYLQ